jgi:hypothetical protein
MIDESSHKTSSDRMSLFIKLYPAAWGKAVDGSVCQVLKHEVTRYAGLGLT